MNFFDITIYTLLIFSLFILIRLLFAKDTSEKMFQKMFGGIIVLLCALVSKNSWAVTISIFIGGLIIASEDFMKFLAAIFATRNDKIPETIQALQPIKISQSDILEKREAEIEEITRVEHTQTENDSLDGDGEKIVTGEENVNFSEEQYADILPKIEDHAIEKIEKSLGTKIERHMSIGGLEFRFDGLIVNNEKRRLRLFEVKVFPKLPRNKHDKVMVFAIVNSIKKYLKDLVPILDNFLEDTSAKAGWKHIFTVIVVLNTNSDFIRIKKRIEELSESFNMITKNFKINFVFYNIKNMELDLKEN